MVEAAAAENRRPALISYAVVYRVGRIHGRRGVDWFDR